MPNQISIVRNNYCTQCGEYMPDSDHCTECSVITEWPICVCGNPVMNHSAICYDCES